MMCVAVTPCARHRVQHSTLQQPAHVNAAMRVLEQRAPRHETCQGPRLSVGETVPSAA